MSNFAKFLQILERGEPSGDYCWTDKEILVVHYGPAIQNVIAAEIAENPQEGLTEDLQAINLLLNWAKKAHAYVYAEESDTYNTIEGIYEAVKDGNNRYVIVERL